MDKRRQLYSDKFSELQAPINKELLWDKIAADAKFPVKKEKKRRFFWLWFSSGVILLIGIVALWFNFSSASKNGISKQQISVKDSQGKAEVPSEIINVEKQDNEVSSSVSISKVNKSNYPPERKAEQKEQKEKAVLSSVSTKLKKLVASTESILPQKLTSHGSSTSVISTSVNKVGASVSFFKDPHPTSQNDIAKMDVSVYPKLPLSSIVLAPTRSLPVNYSRDKIVLAIEPIKVKSPHGTWSLSAALGMGYHIRDFEAVSQDSLPPTAVGETSALESQIVSFDLSRRFLNGWSLGLGLQFSRNYESYIYTEEERIFQRNSTNETAFYSETKTESRYHHFHQFRQFDLKARIGKSWTMKKWKFAANTGVLYNLKFKVSGDFTNENLDRLSIAEVMRYKSKLDLRYFGAIELSRNIFSGQIFTSIQVESSYNLNEASAKFKHRILPIYGQVGYRMGF